jgi:hypothetical protein
MHHATSRKVAGSIPDDVTGFFSLPVYQSFQALTEMSIKNLSGAKDGRSVRLTTSPLSVR